MGNTISTRWRQDRPLPPTVTQPLQLVLRRRQRIYRCTSRSQQIYPKSSHQGARSWVSNPWRHSFLALPKNVRGKIYAKLLIVGEIRISPSQIIQVPGLVILRTCRQVHDEAAAIFYGSSRFICWVQKIVPAQKAGADPQYPALPAGLDWQTLADPLNISGGVFFPAARHHRYLSHLAVHVDVTIVHLATRSPISPIPTFSLVYGESGVDGADMEAMHSSLERMLVRVYQRIKCLWRDRDDIWTGKLVIPERTTWTCALSYMLEFELQPCEKSGAEAAGPELW